jgi:hypothetical protein
MWWKFTLLVLVTVVMVFSVIPIRTHAVRYEPYNDPPPQAWSFMGLLKSMYLTPTSIALIAGILLMAFAVAIWIVRSSR